MEDYDGLYPNPEDAMYAAQEYADYMEELGYNRAKYFLKHTKKLGWWLQWTIQHNAVKGQDITQLDPIELVEIFCIGNGHFFAYYEEYDERAIQDMLAWYDLKEYMPWESPIDDEIENFCDKEGVGYSICGNPPKAAPAPAPTPEDLIDDLPF